MSPPSCLARCAAPLLALRYSGQDHQQVIPEVHRACSGHFYEGIEGALTLYAGRATLAHSRNASATLASAVRCLGGAWVPCALTSVRDSWTFSFDEGAARGAKQTDYEGSLRSLGSFDTVQGFWRYWNALSDKYVVRCPPCLHRALDADPNGLIGGPHMH